MGKGGVKGAIEGVAPRVSGVEEEIKKGMGVYVRR